MIPVLFAWWAALAAPAEAAGYALLVGIDSYDAETGWAPLRGPENDVRAMAAVLEERGFEVRTLLDAAATHDGILAAIAEHLGQAEANDVALFYFSGHGQQVTDDDGDESDGLDESLVPFDNQGPESFGRHLRDDELMPALAALGTERVVTIVDACSAETITRASGQPRGHAPGPAARRKGKGNDGSGGWSAGPPPTGHVVLSASKADQAASERVFASSDGIAQTMGVFTFVLVRGLRTADPNTSWWSLLASLRAQMAALGAIQQPQAEGDVDRVVFGTERRTDGRGYGAMLQDERVLVEAGQLHGLAAGDALGVGCVGSEELETVVLTEVGLDRSLALANGVPQGCALRARVQRFQGGAYAPRVVFEGVPRKARRQMRKVLRPAGLIAKDNHDAPGRVVVTEADERIRLERDGREIPVPAGCDQPVLEALELDAPLLGERVRLAVELDQVRTRLGAMVNRDARSRLPVTLTVRDVDAKVEGEEIVVDADRGPLPTAEGVPRLVTGRTFQLSLRNDATTPVYVSVVEQRTDGRVQTVFPLPWSGRDAGYVEPGAELRVVPLLADETPGRLVFKAIATDRYVDFRALQYLVGCGVTRSAPAEGDGGLLNWFQDALQIRNTRELVPIANAARWGTSSYDVDLVKQ